MGKYNFEKDNGNFGETRRLDTINKEVQKIEKRARKHIEENNDFENIDDEDDGKIFGLNKITAVIIIVLCTVFIAGGCYVLSQIISLGKDTAGNKNSDLITGGTVISKIDESTEDNGIDFGVVVGKTGKSVSVFDTVSNKTIKAEVSNSTVITGANGGRISLADISEGDLVTVKFSEDNKAEEIRFPQDAWRYNSVTGMKIDVEKMSAEIDDKKFEFDDGTFFTYDGHEIYPGDIEVSDTVTLYGTGEHMLSARVEKYHGYIVLKNAEKVENISVTVDFGEPLSADISEIPVSCGRHTVVVSGSNIDDYMAEIDVAEKEKSEIDISSTADRARIVLNVNTDSYNVYINGAEYPKNTTEVSVNKGIYDVAVTADGYRDYSAKADCTSGSIEMDINLEKATILSADVPNTAGKPSVSTPNTGAGTAQEKAQPVPSGNLTVYTNPGWAKVYVNDEYVGVAPVMVSLEYGQYTIKAKDSSGNVEEESVTVDGPDETVKIDF